MTTLRIAYRTVQGRRARNEDAVAIAQLPGRGWVVAVADGMGGHLAGEVASRMACERIVTALAEGADLQSSFTEANLAILEASRIDPGRAGMGTTATVLLVDAAGGGLVASVGDSRGYLVDADSIRQLTVDHSRVQEAVSRGELSEEEARRSRLRHVITRNLGATSDAPADLFPLASPSHPHFVVLCTDGLTDSVNDQDIRNTLLETADVEEAASALVHQALDQGAEDNVSVVIVERNRVPRRLGEPLDPGLTP